MSKTDDTSILGHSSTQESGRKLTEAELDAVSGGVYRITNVRANVAGMPTSPNLPSTIQASIS